MRMSLKARQLKKRAEWPQIWFPPFFVRSQPSSSSRPPGRLPDRVALASERLDPRQQSRRVSCNDEAADANETRHRSAFRPAECDHTGHQPEDSPKQECRRNGRFEAEQSEPY